MKQKKKNLNIQDWISISGDVVFLCVGVALAIALVIGFGQEILNRAAKAVRFIRSEEFPPFRDGLLLGAIATGTIVWLILRKNYRAKLWLLEHKHECYREFQNLKLDYVIVAPLREHRHPDYVAPEREPIAAVINGKKYKAGEEVNDGLKVWIMTDEGATASPSDFEGYDPNEPAVKIGQHTFYGAALADEWEVTLASIAHFEDSKKENDPAFCFHMKTNRANFEDGSDASLSCFKATFVDGREICLPRSRPKPRLRKFIRRRPDGSYEEVMEMESPRWQED